VYDYDADFVFKPLRQHGPLRRALFSSTDWNLVRFCPCPLLLVNHANSIKGNPVIAAVDLASQDDAHVELDLIVLNQARILADVLNSNIHLVHAYKLAVLPVGYAISDPMAYQITKGRRDEQFNKAHKLAKTCYIPDKNVHLEEGAADQVVNRCASELHAGVIVVGTVARSGPSGLFIGNTAESVMESARSDVFVVKQADFESPIAA
jgi:universal stress protein E